MAEEIVAVDVPGKKGSVTVDTDEGPRRDTSMEALAKLKPAFAANGTVTAGNAPGVNDGAAAMIVAADSWAQERGLAPMATILATGQAAWDAPYLAFTPEMAIREALGKTDLSMDDIDLFEINEAFAVQPLGSAQQLGIPLDKLNVNGGAIAVGHPFGMTGARIAATLINSLQWHDKQFGVESMCVGGGMGMAMVIERLS
jgi:acetyl-CoA C-acetyltransferase